MQNLPRSQNLFKGGLTISLQGHSDIAEELLTRGVDVNSRGLHQVSGLVWAAGRGHDDVVKVLLGKKANDYQRQPLTSSTSTDFGRKSLNRNQVPLFVNFRTCLLSSEPVKLPSPLSCAARNFVPDLRTVERAPEADTENILDRILLYMAF